MWNEERPVQVVYILAVQHPASGIVLGGNARPFRIIGRVAVVAVADIAVVERKAARRGVAKDDGAFVMDRRPHALAAHGKRIVA